MCRRSHSGLKSLMKLRRPWPKNSTDRRWSVFSKWLARLLCQCIKVRHIYLHLSSWLTLLFKLRYPRRSLKKRRKKPRRGILAYKDRWNISLKRMSRNGSNWDLRPHLDLLNALCLTRHLVHPLLSNKAIVLLSHYVQLTNSQWKISLKSYLTAGMDWLRRRLK